jgi:hypothetical protein
MPGLQTLWLCERKNKRRGRMQVPMTVAVAALGLVAIGLVVGLVGGLIAGWMMHDRRAV